MDRIALLILGMHRAGTSALARVCSLRGADLPRDVLPANAGNEGGYWEPRGVVELNDRILDYFDLAWDDPFAGLRLPPPESIPAAFHAEARQVIEREYGDSRLFVLKDPRCTLLRAFWTDVLRSLGARACPVVMMRPGEEVIDSLVRRDHTSATSAALLYVAYGLASAEAAEQGASFVTYRQLLADWRGCMDRIAVEQRVAWPALDVDAGARIDAYLQPSPRSARPVALPATVAGWVDLLWSWCRDKANGLTRLESELAAARDDLASLADACAPLLVDRARRQREIDAMREYTLVERDSALRIYGETDALLRSTRADYEARLAGIDAELRRAQADYRERDQQNTAARADLAAARAALAAAYHESDELRRALASILHSRSWRVTRPLRAAMRRLNGQQSGDPDLLRLSATPAPRLDAGAAGAIVGGETAAVMSSGTPFRSHAGLRDFLVAEFGEADAADVVLRIERFGLPVPGTQARAARDFTCTEEEALAWAREIAGRAKQRPQPQSGPDVSIVIPVYNQLPFTLACIDALLAHETRFSFEILVGDDASTDATAAALATPIPGVRHVRHGRNLGFVRNCNETARHARGRYVLFLNNDTLVLPRWLDELVATLESEPGIGLAGSKLVYPDGRLQECGAIVWRDGSAWNLGRLEDPRRPEYGYLRDVDYVSGASIILRRESWIELGGFDELFVPAYAEDADLAFRVRAAGLRTVVQPLSQLLHFEGISSGTDLGSGAKAYQVDNLRKLHERWREVLATHRPNAERPDLEKERSVTRRVLFVDHCTPIPKEDAGSLVAFEVMKAFIDNGYKVTFIPEDNFAHMGGPTRDLQRLGIEPIYHPAYSSMDAFLARRDDPFDVIFLHRYGVGEAHMDALRRKYPGARVIFLNADLHYVRAMRQAELDGDAAALARAQQARNRELRVIAKADVALVHSDYERSLLESELPAARVVLFPLIHDPVDEASPLDGREGVCFVGGFRHPPNADGIRWFVDTAWPLVLDAVPGARLQIVGSHMPAEVVALGEVPGVHAVGFVDDLEELLGRSRVSVAPLRYGAGAKGKVAGSLAEGLPTVCTPVAAEGMLLQDGVNVLVGEDPEQLAAHVVSLLVDDARWLQLSRGGLEYARATTSSQRARERLRRILEA